MCWTLKNKFKNIHDLVGNAIDLVMNESLLRKSYDNVTVVLLAFKHFKKALNNENNIENKENNEKIV